MKLKRYLSLTALLCGIILLGYLFLENSHAPASASQAQITLTPLQIDDPVGRRFQMEIDQYRQDLSNPKLSGENRRSVEANLRFAEQNATQRAIYLNPKADRLAVKLTAIAQETKNPSAKPIQKTTSNPLSSRGIHYDPSFIFIREAGFYSAWVEPSEKDTLWFLGGVLKSDKDQGVVYVYHEQNRQIEKYYTPSKSGLLKTLGFENNRVIYNSEKGTVFYFEINARVFVDVHGNILPSPTPSPTNTQQTAYPVP